MQRHEIQQAFTYTGIALAKLEEELDKELPPEAYKAIEGTAVQSQFTDISPSFMFAELARVFGPIGLGWGYTVLEAQIGEPTPKGRIEAEAWLEVWYRFWTDSYPNGQKSEPIRAFGTSENRQDNWAQSGAITNAIGKAMSMIGWQRSVYKGLRSHTTVRRPRTQAATQPSPPPPPPPPAAKSNGIPHAALATTADKDIVRQKIQTLQALGISKDAIERAFERVTGLTRQTANAMTHQQLATWSAWIDSETRWPRVCKELTERIEALPAEKLLDPTFAAAAFVEFGQEFALQLHPERHPEAAFRAAWHWSKAVCGKAKSPADLNVLQDMLAEFDKAYPDATATGELKRMRNELHDLIGRTRSAMAGKA